MVATAERVGLRGHGEVFKFSADDMRDAGVKLGASRRRVYVPRSVVLPAGGFGRLGRLVREPTMDEMLALGIRPYEVRDAGHNVMCNGGINRMLSLLIAGGGQGYNNANSAIGVGDGGGSTPTGAATDTDLTAATGASHRYIQPSDATYPNSASQVLTVQATVATGNGNFEWREWLISQDTAGSTAAATTPILNHKGVDLGLKTSASAWALKVTITES